MSNGIKYSDMRKVSLHENKSPYGIIVSEKILIQEASKSIAGLEKFIKNTMILENSIGKTLLLPSIIKEVNTFFNTNKASKQDVNMISRFIRENVLIPDFDTIEAYHVSELKNGKDLHENTLYIIESLKSDWDTLNKYRAINRNINMLNKRIGLERIVKENSRLTNKEHIEDLLESVCNLVDRRYDQLRDIIKFGVTMESMKLVAEKYNLNISSEDILYSITEYFYLKDNALSAYTLANCVEGSIVYPDSDKDKILSMLELAIKPEDLLNESKLSSKERKELPNNMFGLPKERKFPLVDKQHVNSAKTYFTKAPEKDRPELAKNILKRSKELGMDINEDSEWFKYTKKNIEEQTAEFFNEGMTLVPMIVEAKNTLSIKNPIAELQKKFIADNDSTPKAAKKFLNKVYAKPLENIIDETPNTLQVIRRVVLIGGGFAINPFLGIALGLIDHLISQIVNLDHAKKLKKKVNIEINRIEKRLDKSDLSTEEKKGYDKYLLELTKRKEKIETFEYNLTSDLEFDDESEDGIEEMALLLALSETFEEFPIEEISTSKVLAHKAKRGAKKGAQNLSAADHRLSKALDTKVDKLKEKIAKSARSDRREAIVKGQIIPSASKLLKIALATGAAWAINPAIAVVGLLGGVGIAKNSTAKERKLILDEIDIELKIVDKKIEAAERNDDMKAYEELLRVKKKLEYEKKRIKYKIRTGSNL